MINSLPIVPGLYGFGTDTRAAYGVVNDPVIFIVTDLTNNNGTPGNSTRNGIPVKTGSFLEAIKYTPPANTGKIILFEVSGTIGSAVSTQIYNIDNQYTSILGQTAPSPGILLKNCQLWVSTSDIFIQHLRMRGVTNIDRDPVVITPKPGTTVNNVVLDHVSVTWGLDETFLIGNYAAGGTVGDITVSNSIIAEGIWTETEAAKCCAVSSIGYESQLTNVCLLNNFFGASQHRHPQMNSTTIALVNNYIYNADERAITTIAPNYAIKLSIIGNVTEGGPMSGVYAENYIFSTFAPFESYWAYSSTSEIYSEDNKCDAGTQSAVNNWDLVDTRSYGDVGAEVIVESKPLWPTGLTEISSANVKTNVLANSGCRPADRDSVDTRLVYEANNGTGISSQLTSTPTFPPLTENNITLNIPSNPHEDSGNGYTNLEVWLHKLAAEVEGRADLCEGVVCENICIGIDLWSRKCVEGECIPDQLLESNSVTCGYDPCEGVVCDNICIGIDMWSQKCVEGDCVPDQLLESNSVTCGYDPCEGVICDNICIGIDMWSQKCVEGECIPDQLLESNSVTCELCEGVVCGNTCVGDDLWSQICDPNTGTCVANQLLQQDSINCKIPDKVPSDESTIKTYIILGGFGIMGLAMLILNKK